MMNFRKIAAASKGRLLLRYFTENTPEPIHPAPVDEAGRQLEEGGRLTAYYTGRDSRATWRPDMPASWRKAIGIDPRQMPRDAEMSRLFEARRADTGEAWSQHKRKLSGFDLVFSPHKSVTSRGRVRAHAGGERGVLECRRSRQRPRHALCGARNSAGRAKARAARTAPTPARSAGSASGTTPRGQPCRCRTGKDGQTYLFDAPVAGDPHMHIHNFLMNLVVTAEGRVGSLDTQGADRRPGQGVRRLLPGRPRRRTAAARRRDRLRRERAGGRRHRHPGAGQQGVQQARHADPAEGQAVRRKRRVSTGMSSRPNARWTSCEEAERRGPPGQDEDR